jgi:uncharacterized membrane protein SpoIIM required for sporulation
MRETKFIEQKKEQWAEFEQLLRENRRDPDRLNDLFVQITDDLSYARTFYPNRSVRLYLNGLAQRVFHNIYRGRRFPAERFRLFWTDELPRTVWEARQAMLLSLGIFVLAFAIGVLSSMINPDFARIILGDGYVDMTLRNIEEGDPMAVYKESRPLGMSVGIAANNLFVALRTAIFGVFASIGTLFIMLYNGIMVGAFQYFFIERGLFWESFLTIWIHGTLEISAIIIAGASGLVAGSGLLFPGTYTRVQALQLSLRRGLKIFIGVVPLLLLAAFFEGFLTRYTGTPALIRGSFIGVSLFFVLWYFGWYPWYKSRRGFAPVPGRQELPPDRIQPIDFTSIKSSGGILSDVFTVFKRHLSVFLPTIFGAALLFNALAYGLADKAPSDALPQGYGVFGIFQHVRGLFGKVGMRHFFFLQSAVLVWLALTAFYALRRELPSEAPENRRLSAGQLLLTALALLLPSAAMALMMRAEEGAWIWVLTMTLCPVLALWAALLFFESPNPLLALARLFPLLRYWSGLLLGLLLANLGFLMLWFLESGIWSTVTNFFSWLAPPGEGNVGHFMTVFTSVSICLIVYFLFTLLFLCGGLQYFSNREMVEALYLRESISGVGSKRKVRGLARE